MSKKLLALWVMCLVVVLKPLTCFAEVSTLVTADADKTAIYVAGNADFYPIEYYNDKTKQFEGLMPDVLRDVSEKTGIDFVYLHSKELSQKNLVESLQVEIVSAYITDANEAYAKDSVIVFSYNDHGKIVNIGWAFTEAAEKELIDILKAEATQLSQSELNGYLVSSSKNREPDLTIAFVTLIVCALMLGMAVALVLINRKKAKKQMLRNKQIDDETGIGNLIYFGNYFNKKITDFSRELYYIAYIIIDSSYLQVYHGEASFTDVIKYTAGVLTDYSKHNEFAARITENSFAFAFQKQDDEEAGELMDKILEKLTLYIGSDKEGAKPVFYASVYKLNKEDKNCELLLFNLRKNCSKYVGSDKQYVFCSSHMMNSAAEEKEFLESINEGFENHEFKLYLQFVVDNKTKKIVSAESLSRWESRKKGLLMPGAYIGLMESTGMISQLDYYMFEQACMQLHKWKDTEFGHLALSCNFTRITISDVDFVERIKDIARKFVFNKEQLIIEITEDAIERNHELAMENVIRCKEEGFKIALDDMGSGYTSLVNMCEYPIDIVKVDRDVLLRANKKNGRDLFMGIIALSHSLGLKVVCEGVETEEQNELATTSGCDLIQGWYYSLVYPADESENYYREYSKKL